MLLACLLTLAEHDVSCRPAIVAECSGATCLRGKRQFGCIQPPPVEGQCSFPRFSALHLCRRWPECVAVNCAASRSDCQARGEGYRQAPSFGDGALFVPHAMSNGTSDSRAVCLGRLRSRASSSDYAGGVHEMRCSAGTCMTSQADPKLVLAAERRLRRLSRQRRLLNSSQPEPLLIFTPVPPATASPIVAYDLAPKAFASGRVGGGESWAERAIVDRATRVRVHVRRRLLHV